MNNNNEGFGAFVGVAGTLIFMTGLIAGVIEPQCRDEGYNKGVRDCKNNTINYDVHITPTDTDTTYIYKK